MEHILALDQGTTSSRAIVFDRHGRCRGSASQEFRQIFPRPGWVEHDPTELWSSQLAAARQAVAGAGLTFADIAAIGIANQRETTVVWDRRTGEPVCNAIVWQDRRTAGACDRLREAGHEEVIQRKTGLRLDPYFSGTKLAWILDNVRGARRRAEAGELAFGTVDTWLVWNLTGGSVHVTDAANAARTLLLDIHTGRWDDDLLGILDIPPGVLPEVRSCSEVVGQTAPGVLETPVPVAGMVGDQQAALFGQMCVRRGMVKTTYGTGCFMLLNTGEQAVPSRSGLLTTIASRIGDRVQYALEGSVFVGGAVVQWLRDGLGLIDSAEEVESLAAGVPDNGGVVLVPAFAGLGAPHWDPYARGLMAGLTRGTTAGHLARAALEAIALQVADVLEAMEADAGVCIAEVRVDGGAAANDLLMQLQADVLGVPVLRPAMLETTAVGAACLAGLAVGFWQDLADLAGQWRADRTFTPAMPAEQVAGLRANWLKALDRAKGWQDP
ncbi:MAG: glycerol kinase GlpK [Planctomycetota bacterium]|jgi:glycerol kinase